MQHIRRSRLLFQCLAQISCALTQFIEQPRVLDGDDSLGGKVLHQRNLLIAERADFLPIDVDGADQFGFLKHRHHDKATHAAKFDNSNGIGIALLVSRLLRVIHNMNRLFRADYARKGRQRTWSE